MSLSQNPIIKSLHSSTIVGALTVFGILLFILHPITQLQDEGVLELYARPAFFAWISLILIQAAFYPILGIMLWRQLFSLFWKDLFVKNKLVGWTTSIFSIVTIASLYGLPFIVPNKLWQIPPIRGLDPTFWDLSAVYIFGGLLTLPAVLGIPLLHVAVHHLFSTIQSNSNDQIEKYKRFRDYLHRNTLILGVTVSLGTLNIGIFRIYRNSICDDLVEANAICPKTLNESALCLETAVECVLRPTDVVFIGLFYSVLIAVIYLRSHVSLQELGRRISDAFHPLPVAGSSAWKDTNERRKDFEEYLQLRLVTPQAIQALGAILAPLISAIIATREFL